MSKCYPDKRDKEPYSPSPTYSNQVYGFCVTFIDKSWKMTEFNLNCFLFSKLLLITILLIASSYAAYPPPGDANCYKGSCESVNCKSVDCSFGKLMTDPGSSCGCCKLCLSYIGKNADFVAHSPPVIKKTIALT